MIVGLIDFSNEDLSKLGHEGRELLIDAVASGDKETVNKLYRGLHPQTHQEFIQTCSTEELAEWIKTVTRHCYACGYDMARNGLQTKTKCPFGRCVADDAESWPKEKKE